MGRVEFITKDESTAAYGYAVALAREMIGTERGFVSPNARVGTMSDYEWNKLAIAMVSGWIAERSRQLTAERFWSDEAAFLASGEVPEPADLGCAMTALPALGDLVEKLGIGDSPIGSWTKEQITLFVWSAFEIVGDARVARDERPSPLKIGEIAP